LKFGDKDKDKFHPFIPLFGIQLNQSEGQSIGRIMIVTLSAFNLHCELDMMDRWESTTAMGNSFQDEAETSKERKQCKVENLDGPFEQTELEDANEDKAYQLSRDKGALESLGPPPKVRLYGIQSTPKATLIVLTAVATLSAFLLGLDLTTINGAQLYLDPYLRLNTAEKSLVPSGIALGAMFGGAV
jgi:hypothetical protein